MAAGRLLDPRLLESLAWLFSLDARTVRGRGRGTRSGKWNKLINALGGEYASPSDVGLRMRWSWPRGRPRRPMRRISRCSEAGARTTRPPTCRACSSQECREGERRQDRHQDQRAGSGAAVRAAAAGFGGRVRHDLHPSRPITRRDSPASPKFSRSIWRNRASSGVWDHIDKFYQKTHNMKILALVPVGTEGYHCYLRTPLVGAGRLERPQAARRRQPACGDQGARRRAGRDADGRRLHVDRKGRRRRRLRAGQRHARDQASRGREVPRRAALRPAGFLDRASISIAGTSCPRTQQKTLIEAGAQTERDTARIGDEILEQREQDARRAWRPGAATAEGQGRTDPDRCSRPATGSSRSNAAAMPARNCTSSRARQRPDARATEVDCDGESEPRQSLIRRRAASLAMPHLSLTRISAIALFARDQRQTMNRQSAIGDHMLDRLSSSMTHLTAVGFAGAAAVCRRHHRYRSGTRWSRAISSRRRRSWAYDVASYALCPMIFLSMPAMTRRDAHIAVSYLVEGCPQRYRDRSCMLVLLAAAVVCLIGAWITGAETWRQYVRGVETISAVPISKWWISVFIPYGMLSSGAVFSASIRSASGRRRRRRMEARS